MEVRKEFKLMFTSAKYALMREMLNKAFRNSYALGAAVIALFIQIAFLDALDNRCVWGILSIVAILPRK